MKLKMYLTISDATRSPVLAPSFMPNRRNVQTAKGAMHPKQEGNPTLVKYVSFYNIYINYQPKY